MLTKKIPVPEDLTDYVEKLNYTADALRLLLCDMVAYHLDEEPVFKKWEQQYMNCHAEFMVAKSTVESKYVKPHIGEATVNWNLDYNDSVVYIQEVTHAEKG